MNRLTMMWRGLVVAEAGALLGGLAGLALGGWPGATFMLAYMAPAAAAVGPVTGLVAGAITHDRYWRVLLVSCASYFAGAMLIVAVLLRLLHARFDAWAAFAGCFVLVVPALPALLALWLERWTRPAAPAY